jgi:peptide-methionine (R)-S-oxide reductase
MLKYNLILALLLLTIACQSQQEQSSRKTKNMNYKVQKSESEWQTELTPAQFNVLRLKGTEPPRTGEYELHFEKGTYACAGCGTKLFESNSKYESHCGWPSFDDAIQGTVEYKKDNTLGMIRTEILCANCGGHLGHIFDDGPQETTGKRYCVNSLSLEFKKE